MLSISIISLILACHMVLSPVQAQSAKKVLMVIAKEGFRDEELFETRKQIERKGHKVSVASTTTSEARGAMGGTIKPDLTVSAVDVSIYDAVVFVGGPGAKVLLKDEKILALAKAAAQAGKLVAAICIAPEILANAGLLKGKKATAWRGSQDHLKAKGALVKAGPVVQDGRIITGNGPGAARAFGEAIAKYLSRP